MRTYKKRELREAVDAHKRQMAGMHRARSTGISYLCDRLVPEAPTFKMFLDFHLPAGSTDARRAKSNVQDRVRGECGAQAPVGASAGSGALGLRHR